MYKEHFRLKERPFSIAPDPRYLNAYLLDAYAKGRKTVLIIEEAQDLSIEVLEQVRLLTNLETNKQKLLQIVLLGQTELKYKLSRPELRQLSQRITARYHLGPLSKQEVSAYVQQLPFRWVFIGLLILGCVLALSAIYYHNQANPLTIFTSTAMHQKIVPGMKEHPSLSIIVNVVEG
jgi:hypothetical protein